MRWLVPALTLLVAGCAGLAPPTPPSAPPAPIQHPAQLETEPRAPQEAAGTPPAPTSDICSTAELALPGVISRVVDGDTADVLLEGDDRPTRIRFYGIDTPERGQPMYRSATEELQGMIGGEAIDLVPTEQRTFDRIVGTVCVGAVNVNKEMVRRGYAWAYRQYLGAEDGDEDYCRLEAQARQRRLGLVSASTTCRAVGPTTRQKSMRARASGGSAQSRRLARMDGGRRGECVLSTSTREVLKAPIPRDARACMVKLGRVAATVWITRSITLRSLAPALFHSDYNLYGPKQLARHLRVTLLKQNQPGPEGE